MSNTHSHTHSNNNTLLIKNLPACLSENEVVNLIETFGAERVTYMGKHGSMKHCAFAKFESPKMSTKCLLQLHQMTILKNVICVEYARNTQALVESVNVVGNVNVSAGNVSTSTSTGHDDKTFLPSASQKGKGCTPVHRSVLKTNHMSKGWEIPYCIDERLVYRYPTPTDTTMRNIIHCMASVPKFYTQVLHLMNKMNLPPPFWELTTAPPVKQGIAENSDTRMISSSDESELSSAEDNCKTKKDIMEG